MPIRFAVIQAADDDTEQGYIQTNFIRGTNEQVKNLLDCAGAAPLYIVRVILKPTHPGYIDWCAARMGLNFEDHAGNA